MKKIFLIIPLMILSTTLFGKTGIEIAKELNVSPSAKVIAQWTNIFEKKKI